MRDRRKRAPHVPDGYVVPEGFVLVTESSWHGVQLGLRAMVLAAVLIVCAGVALTLQVNSRNRDIDQVQAAARAAESAAKDAKAVVQAAVASSQNPDQLRPFFVQVRQTEAICIRVVGEATCDEIEARVLAGG